MSIHPLFLGHTVSIVHILLDLLLLCNMESYRWPVIDRLWRTCGKYVKHIGKVVITPPYPDFRIHLGLIMEYTVLKSLTHACSPAYAAVAVQVHTAAYGGVSSMFSIKIARCHRWLVPCTMSQSIPRCYPIILECVVLRCSASSFGASMLSYGHTSVDLLCCKHSHNYGPLTKAIILDIGWPVVPTSLPALLAWVSSTRAVYSRFIALA